MSAAAQTSASARTETEKRVWILNPGAELEVRQGGPRARGEKERSEIAARRSLWDGLCAGERAFLDEELQTDSELWDALRGRRACLFCPTPWVRQAAEQRGLVPQPGPPLEVLRRVLSKNYLSEALPAWVVPGHHLLSSFSDFERARRELPGPLRIKRLAGFAGKGQRVVAAELRAGDQRWVEDVLRGEGAVLEPELDGAEALSIHGVATPSQLLWGRPCRIEVDRFGAPTAAPRRYEDCPWANAACAVAEDAARALREAGYFGPFGVDLVAQGERIFAIDLNARFTLGFSAGLGERREEALELVARPE